MTDRSIQKIFFIIWSLKSCVTVQLVKLDVVEVSRCRRSRELKDQKMMDRKTWKYEKHDKKCPLAAQCGNHRSDCDR